MRRQQGGFVLVVSLLMIVILSIIGITGMSGSNIEEKVVRNTKNQDVAFQAAESAVRDAEVYITSIASPSAFNGTHGLYASTSTNPDYTLAASWGTTVSVTAATSIPSSASAGRYYIKLMTTISSGASSEGNVTGYGETMAGGTVTVFKITARGTGATSDSQAFIESYYGKLF